MKSQSNEYPSVIQKLDSNTFVFNYNVVESKNENISGMELENGGNDTIYTYDQVVVNSSTINKDDIIRNTIIENFDINQQLKLVNDYISYTMGILKDEIYVTRYRDFLEFRALMKETILNLVII